MEINIEVEEDLDDSIVFRVWIPAIDPLNKLTDYSVQRLKRITYEKMNKSMKQVGEEMTNLYELLERETQR